MSKLSIVYITLNAEAYLIESLSQSQKLSDDLLIVDSGSTDNTLTIAKSAGARVIQQTWLGFAGQKQFAIDSASNDLVLLLDADEVLTDEAITVIKQSLALLANGQKAAFSVRRKNYFQGKWIRYGSWWPDRVTRVIDRTQGHMKQVTVHECWETSGVVEKLDIDLLHYSYQDYSQLIHKADRYSTLAAEQLMKNRKKCSKWSPLHHGLASFIRLFFLKQGFRDGIEGAAIAGTSALASFMKYAKLQELNSKNGNRTP